MNKAVFLDRDGTLIPDHGYLRDPSGVELLPGVGEALSRMQSAGYHLILVTNQSGVGRGYFAEQDVHEQHQRLRRLLSVYGVELADIKVCLHAPEAECDCRKPRPALLTQAAAEHNIDLTSSWMIGDKNSDVKAGVNSGCRTLLLGADNDSPADWQADTLEEACRCILDCPRVAAVIPARYGSTRFPGKALAHIAGKPMIQWVYEAARSAARVERVLVAADDQRIIDTVQGFGGEAVMTSVDHPTGTDRIVEAIRDEPAGLIVNVQGDEPLLSGRCLDRLVWRVVAKGSDMGTIAVPFDRVQEPAENPDLVKVVIDKQGRALYFSRAKIPFLRQGGEHVNPLLHWGIYAYRREILEKFVSWPQSELEKSEMLEQLRALENGVEIQVLLAEEPTIGVDVPEDAEKAAAILAARQLVW